MSELLGEKIHEYEDMFYFEKIIYMNIYKAVNIKKDKLVTLKIIDKERFRNYDMGKEKEIVNLCHSKNILNIYDCFETEKNYIVEQESYETNLFEYIKENGPAQENLPFFKGVFLEIAKALRLIHQKGIMHRCIRTNHIFLVNKENEDYNDLEYSVKLGGFNFAIYIKDNKSEPLDTIFYTAPEIINGEEYNEKCDLWSFGITLYQLYFGKFPYGFKPSKYMVVKLVSDEEDFNYEKTNLPALDAIFNGLLQINPKKRLTHEQFFDLVFNYDFMSTQTNPNFKKKYFEYMTYNVNESKKPIKAKESKKSIKIKKPVIIKGIKNQMEIKGIKKQMEIKGIKKQVESKGIKKQVESKGIRKHIKFEVEKSKNPIKTKEREKSLENIKNFKNKKAIITKKSKEIKKTRKNKSVEFKEKYKKVKNCSQNKIIPQKEIEKDEKFCSIKLILIIMIIYIIFFKVIKYI